LGKLRTVPQTSAPIQIGWQYMDSTAEFKQHVMESTINVISPRWFFMGKDGALTVSVEPELVEWAHAKQKKVWALVGNRSNAEVLHLFLTVYKNSVITQLVNYASQYKLDGFNLDFENVDPDDRDLLTAFVKDLGTRLHSAGKVISIDVPPDSNTDWSQPFDYAALSASADYLVLMGYEEHWAGSSVMGSVASLPWFIQGVKQINKEISTPSKLIVGMPLFTRDWRIEAGKVLSEDIELPDQEQLLPIFSSLKWDPSVGQYTAVYTNNHIIHNIWLEDSRSLTLKYVQSLNEKAAGFAYWYTGGATADIWAALRNANRLSKLRFVS
jgi:spore germination protein